MLGCGAQLNCVWNLRTITHIHISFSERLNQKQIPFDHRAIQKQFRRTILVFRENPSAIITNATSRIRKHATITAINKTQQIHVVAIRFIFIVIVNDKSILSTLQMISIVFSYVYSNKIWSMFR